MGISLIYFGKLGGGTQFAKAVYSSLDSNKTRLFVSESNDEFLNMNVESISGIPSGLLRNLLFLTRLRRRKKILSELCNKIGNDVVIFLMPHPFDFSLRKCLKLNTIFTVIHDAKKHAGDIWPSNSTIRKLGKAPGTKIFLSAHVKDSSRVFTVGPSLQLPLLMGKSSETENIERDIDVAFLGRHKKYKDIKFQLTLINHLNENLKIYFSTPKGFKHKLTRFDNLIIKEDWLKTEEFQSILSRSKTIVLTHAEASQSGLILDAIRFGACPVIPNIKGLDEQANHLGIPWIYEPTNKLEAEKQIIDAIAQRESVNLSRKILEVDSIAWSKFFRDWM
jgi:hypothetical protein